MSQAYIHACERAELLGLPIPSEEEWKETHNTDDENYGCEEDDDTVIQVIALTFLLKRNSNNKE